MVKNCEECVAPTVGTYDKIADRISAVMERLSKIGKLAYEDLTRLADESLKEGSSGTNFFPTSCRITTIENWVEQIRKIMNGEEP